MSDYTRRYEFKKKEVTGTPVSTEPQTITDSRVKLNIPTALPIKSYKLNNGYTPVLLVPLKWNSRLNMWELTTSDSFVNATVDSNNYLNVHAQKVEQLPSSLSSAGNLKVSLEETSIKQPVDKQAIYRVQVVESTTALDASASFTSASIDTTNFSKLQGFVYADVDGTLKLQMSSDNSNWYDYKTYSVTGGTPLAFNDDVVTPYMRVVYTNGATAQTSFRLEVYEVVL